MISYWRPISAPAADAPQARVARKTGAEVTPDTLRAIARQPLKPVVSSLKATALPAGREVLKY